MIILTRQGSADSTSARWARQYRGTKQPDKIEKLERLQALEKPVDPDKVDAIIGNTSWTRLNCDECGKECNTVIQVGQAPDYESSTAQLCMDCLSAAMKMMGAAS